MWDCSFLLIVALIELIVRVYDADGRPEVGHITLGCVAVCLLLVIVGGLLWLALS